MGIWYGIRPRWWAPLERDARHRFGDDLRHSYGKGRLTYRLSGLDVFGEPTPVPVTVCFFDEPCYPTFGQRPQDFPRIYAKLGAASKHRYSTDGALCLWYPYDPEERRWTSPKGLLHLFEIVRTHLFLEHYWRLTGGEWLVEDAPHGLPGGNAWVPASSARPRRRRAAGRGPRPPL
ncbi:hypothetical protein [Streptomyces vinaceus]|uniref:hypothetical protein n=1 Tax=Streptomyces vinaceus TaxID=1960 RepID=UPI003821B0D7